MAETNEQVIKRALPFHREAEQSILGAMLLNPDKAVYVTEHLQSDDFYETSHKILFEALTKLMKDQIHIDMVTLQGTLKDMGAPPEICEIGYLRNLMDMVPTTVGLEDRCKRVADCSVARRLIKAGEAIATAGYARQGSIAEQIESAERMIFDVVQRRSSDKVTPVGDIVVETLEMIRKASLSNGEVTGLATGFTDLDDMTSGLQPSALILIAARPAMGKTAFALNIAAHAAITKKKKVAVFSLEMSKEDLMKRLLSMHSYVNSSNIRDGKVTSEDWLKLVEAAGDISNTSIYLFDDPNITAAQMRSRCRKLMIDEGLDLVIVDYLQLMNAREGSDARGDSRQVQISEISRSLKIMARELNIPVIALSQLSRAVESRQDHRPMLSDLRESGAIEQDADIVMFIYRDEVYKATEENKNKAEIIIAKHRNGQTGTVHVWWNGEITRFLSKDYQGET